MRAAIYVRVSTVEQAEEGYSIKAQIERLNAYAVSQGWIVTKTYIDDGQSAKDMNRTNLTLMLEDMKENMFDVVLVYKLDRLTRSVLDLYKMLEIFEKHNVKFKSATEVYDTTNAMGRLFITLVAALAQWERENLSERVQFGMTQKAKEGKWTVSLTPFGFDRNGDYLKINNNESKIVKEIFELYLTGKYGTGKIATILNQRQIKTKTGSNWTDTKIKYILTNKIYIGTMRYNYRVHTENYFEIENVVTPIIDESDFNEVQRILALRSTNHPRKATSPYIFTTVLKCHRCGASMVGKQSGGIKHGNLTYHYYCYNKRFGLCDLPTISQNFLEIQLLNLIENWEYQHLISDQVSNLNTPHMDIEERLADLKKELNEINERRKQWQYAWANKLITDNDLLNRNKEEDEAEISVMITIKKLEQSKNMDVKQETLKTALNNIQENWISLEVYEKKRLIEMLIKEIYIDKIDGLRKPESVLIKKINFL
ncbi:putative integrase; bacteriophage 370.1 [Lysinibacillus sp. PLM2]|nr:putative integrase; bacteriophage 370.1 [Lysinibacillus sp. PLM2]